MERLVSFLTGDFADTTRKEVIDIGKRAYELYRMVNYYENKTHNYMNTIGMHMYRICNLFVIRGASLVNEIIDDTYDTINVPMSPAWKAWISVCKELVYDEEGENYESLIAKKVLLSQLFDLKPKGNPPNEYAHQIVSKFEELMSVSADILEDIKNQLEIDLHVMESMFIIHDHYRSKLDEILKERIVKREIDMLCSTIRRASGA